MSWEEHVLGRGSPRMSLSGAQAEHTGPCSPGQHLGTSPLRAGRSTRNGHPWGPPPPDGLLPTKASQPSRKGVANRGATLLFLQSLSWIILCQSPNKSLIHIQPGHLCFPVGPQVSRGNSRKSPGLGYNLRKSHLRCLDQPGKLHSPQCPPMNHTCVNMMKPP